jgi:hypothetical protein
MAKSHTTGEAGSGPLIVVGMWRSGTSLLYTLLNQHPQIALLYEGDLPLLRPLFSRKGSNRDWLTRWEFWNSALSRHRIPVAKIPATVPDLSTGAIAVWKEYAGGRAVMGEKSPNYFDSLQVLAREFPGARFIVIWRDLNDICRSIVRAGKGSSFFAKPGIAHRAILGYHELKLECDALVSQQVPLYQIQYEEMVQDSTRVMTGVCEFLGIAFDSRMCSLEGSDRSAIYEGAHHEQVKREKIRSSTGRNEVLSPRLRRKIGSYVAYWKRESNQRWPLYPKSGQGFECPGVVERFLDYLLFRSLRILDGFTAFVYCYAPIGWLHRYRTFKNRRYQNAGTLSGQAGPTQSSAGVEALRPVEAPELK